MSMNFVFIGFGNSRLSFGKFVIENQLLQSTRGFTGLYHSCSNYEGSSILILRGTELKFRSISNCSVSQCVAKL